MNRIYRVWTGDLSLESQIPPNAPGDHIEAEDETVAAVQFANRLAKTGLLSEDHLVTERGMFFVRNVQSNRLFIVTVKFEFQPRAVVHNAVELIVKNRDS